MLCSPNAPAEMSVSARDAVVEKQEAQLQGGCAPPPATCADLDHARYMSQAIALSARGGLEEKTGGCFGAVVVDGSTGEIVGEAFNRVVADVDPSAHAEVLAIRRAAKRLGRPHLEGCVLYSSAQPCPMCHCTALWAHVDKVFYGATYQDVMRYGKFQDADFLDEMLRPAEKKAMPVTPLMRDEAVKPWIQFENMPDKLHY